MVLELKSVKYRILTINTCVKTKEFRELNPSLKVPVLLHGTNLFSLTSIDDSELAIEYIDTLIPQPSLKPIIKRRLGVGNDGSSVYSRFAALMKNKDPAKDNKLKERLLSELKQLDIFLQSRKTESGAESYYLDGKGVSLADCSLLPKLWELKVAGVKKNFEIPSSLQAVTEYLAMAQKNTAFARSKPSDRDIIEHWSNN